jgi:multidrug efflux pump subunit AcrB
VSNIPLGSFQINESTYDFRIDKTVTNEQELLKISIPTPNGSILLGSIAQLDRDYGEEVSRKIGKYQDSGYHYVSLNFKKPKSIINVQTAANQAKEEVSVYMEQFQDE